MAHTLLRLSPGRQKRALAHPWGSTAGGLSLMLGPQETQAHYKDSYPLPLRKQGHWMSDRIIFYFFKIYLYKNVSVYGAAYLSTGDCRGHEGSQTPRAGVTGTEDHWVWVLGTELRSYGWALHALNFGAISPDQHLLLKRFISSILTSKSTKFHKIC